MVELLSPSLLEGDPSLVNLRELFFGGLLLVDGPIPQMRVKLIVAIVEGQPL